MGVQGHGNSFTSVEHFLLNFSLLDLWLRGLNESDKEAATAGPAPAGTAPEWDRALDAARRWIYFSGVVSALPMLALIVWFGEVAPTYRVIPTAIIGGNCASAIGMSAARVTAAAGGRPLPFNRWTDIAMAILFACGALATTQVITG